MAESASSGEQAERERSDFLEYRNHRGEVADFHAFRHRFVTELVSSGVLPKDAKELARHSTITLTMDCYSHMTIQDTASALNRLSVISGDTQAEAEPRRVPQRVPLCDETRQNLMRLEESAEQETTTAPDRKPLELQQLGESLEDLATDEEVQGNERCSSYRMLPRETSFSSTCICVSKLNCFARSTGQNDLPG